MVDEEKYLQMMFRYFKHKDFCTHCEMYYNMLSIERVAFIVPLHKYTKVFGYKIIYEW